SSIDRVRDHLCTKGIFGDVAELCEMRGDCTWVVTCPDCGTMFTLDDDEHDELLSWSRAAGQSCGISA
ncbi:MAG TPA: hypothetical protein DEU95_04855, partial [Chloroflexi bacterium]|nr:hypothetical protein [Chloroflexota bacterium]